MSDKAKIFWLKEPEEHNYPAALSYLSLVFNSNEPVEYVGKLREAPVSEFKAKDIFRASGLPSLGLSNENFRRDQKKISDGKALSPILLVRDSVHGKLIIADGYHRLCAVYSYNEDELIPCKIV